MTGLDRPAAHPWIWMTPPRVQIDTGLYEVIGALWDAGVVTLYCCQGEHYYGLSGGYAPNYPHGYGYIMLAHDSHVDKATSILEEHGLKNITWSEGGTPPKPCLKFDPVEVNDDVQ